MMVTRLVSNSGVVSCIGDPWSARGEQAPFGGRVGVVEVALLRHFLKT